MGFTRQKTFVPRIMIKEGETIKISKLVPLSTCHFVSFGIHDLTY